MEVIDLLKSHDLILFDQYGVLHDGVHPIDESLEIINYLLENKKQIAIISNSSMCKKYAQEKMIHMGFPFIENFITSGEITWNYIKNNYKNKCVLCFTWKNEKHFFNNLSLTTTTNPAYADFLLLHGSEIIHSYNEDQIIFHDIKENGRNSPFFNKICMLLHSCAKRKLVAICANPDIMVCTSQKKYNYMPGFIANIYKQYGGSVIYFGKPYACTFEEAISRTNNIPKTRILHIGDSLDHDIKGAQNSNIHSLLITDNGVHKDLLNLNNNLINNIKVLCDEKQMDCPNYVSRTLHLRAKTTEITHDRTR